jgi:NADH:ubiquinone oxidoreductase subunit E
LAYSRRRNVRFTESAGQTDVYGTYHNFSRQPNGRNAPRVCSEISGKASGVFSVRGKDKLTAL